MLAKVLVLGAKGMAGHVISSTLIKSNHKVTEFSRNELQIDDQGSWKQLLQKELEDNKYTHIINCIGVLKRQANSNPILAIRINSLFPHELAEIANKKRVKVFHLSTDCFNDLDTYGRSKRAGELQSEENCTIRTSIIGPELKEDGEGLFHWFITQTGEVNGFLDHIWDGITTLELANQMIKAINEDWKGIVDIRSSKVSKEELLRTIKEVFNVSIEVEPKHTEKVDKTASSPSIKVQKTIKEQIQDLRKWMITNKDIYKSTPCIKYL